jgi:hypothetical protein
MSSSPLAIWPIFPEPTQQANRPTGPTPLSSSLRRSSTPPPFTHNHAMPCRPPPSRRTMEQTRWPSPSLTEFCPSLPSLTLSHFLPLHQFGNGTNDGAPITVSARSSRPPPPPSDPYKWVPRPRLTLPHPTPSSLPSLSHRSMPPP